MFFIVCFWAGFQKMALSINKISLIPKMQYQKVLWSKPNDCSTKLVFLLLTAFRMKFFLLTTEGSNVYGISLARKSRPQRWSYNLLSHLVSIVQIAKGLLGQILNTLNNDIAQSAKTFNQALAMQPPGNSKINYSFVKTL